MRIVLEHLTMSALGPDVLAVHVEREALTAEANPVAVGFAHSPSALSHSTSWRCEEDQLLLTFVHVLPDGAEIAEAWIGSPAELESLPSACHAVRHLHFLRFTDEEIAAYPDIAQFWAFAHDVADHHYPAVAGLLTWHGLDDQDFVI